MAKAHAMCVSLDSEGRATGAYSAGWMWCAGASKAGECAADGYWNCHDLDCKQNEICKQYADGKYVACTAVSTKDNERPNLVKAIEKDVKANQESTSL